LGKPKRCFVKQAQFCVGSVVSAQEMPRREAREIRNEIQINRQERDFPPNKFLADMKQGQ